MLTKKRSFLEKKNQVCNWSLTDLWMLSDLGKYQVRIRIRPYILLLLGIYWYHFWTKVWIIHIIIISITFSLSNLKLFWLNPASSHNLKDRIRLFNLYIYIFLPSEFIGDFFWRKVIIFFFGFFNWNLIRIWIWPLRKVRICSSVMRDTNTIALSFISKTLPISTVCPRSLVHSTPVMKHAASRLGGGHGTHIK